MNELRELKAGKLLVKVFNERVVMGKSAAVEVAEKIATLLETKNEINMLFAAAPSQNDFLAELVNNSNIKWESINAYHLDEYIGLEASAPQGFGNFLRAKIFDKVNFKSMNFLNGNADNIELENIRYSEKLENSHIDIACIGIGENGHLAFNDPHVSHFDDEKLVKVVMLDQKCRLQQVHDGCFEKIDDVPVSALTLTIPAILGSDFIYCIVPSKTKAEAVRNTVEGEIRETNPASIMRLKNNTILYTDAESASLLH